MASLLLFEGVAVEKRQAAAVFHSCLGRLFFPSILDRISENLVPDASLAVHVRLLCRHGSLGQQEESMWGASEPTFQDDTLIVRIHCFKAHLASYRMSPTIVKGKTALPSGNFVTSKCF